MPDPDLGAVPSGLWQFGDIGRNPPRLVARETLHHVATTLLVFKRSLHPCTGLTNLALESPQ
jgi:hypothetical protein